MVAEFDESVGELREALARLRAGGLASRLRAVPRLVRAAYESVRQLRTLPRLVLAVPSTPRGVEVVAAARRRIFRVVPNRLAAGVLELPVDAPERYLSGRSRQALRTNVTRARNVGLRCRRLTWFETAAAVEAVLPDGRHRSSYAQWLDVRIQDKRGDFWAVQDAEGQVRALMVVTAAGEVAYLNWMLTAEADDRSAARYLLSAEVFQALAEQGVRYVLTGSALGMSGGLAYFQRRLGFEPRNVRLRLSA